MLPGVVTSARLWGMLFSLATLLRGGATLQQQELFHYDADGQPVVRTAKGVLKGLREESVDGHAFLSFYAVPYAQPPLRDLRFQAPVEEAAWTGVRDAVAQPEPCVQVTFKRAKLGVVSEDDVIGSEDCLYLNVFTRKVGVDVGTGLPVMVYLHGGGWLGGAAHEFQPHVLLDHAVVLVVPQFRLGTLAFLSTEDEVMPGNYMLRDQLAVLGWVQRNIRTFGGDPARVTLFGQSAGGTSASLLSLSPKARGLFSRTVWHSGTALAPFTFGRRHQQVAEETATSMGLAGNLDSRSILAFLQTVSSKTLALIAYKYSKWFTLPNVMGPRVDGDLIPEDPFKMMQTMMCPPWQLMSGYTAQDGALLTHHFYNRESLRTRLRQNFPEIGPLSLALADDDKNALMKATTLYKYYLGEDNGTHLRENYTQVMSNTRSKSLLWLLDKSSKQEFLGSRLPSREEVLLVFLHHHHVIRETMPEAAKSVSLKLHQVWDKASLPVKAEHVIRRNIKTLHTEYMSLKKEKNRTTPAAVTKREIWKGDLHDLFDIASENITQMGAVLEEDLAFLELQREDRQSSSMSSVDKVLAAAVGKKAEKEKIAEMRRRKQAKDVDEMFEKVDFESSSTVSSTSILDDDFHEGPSPNKTARRSAPSKKQNPITPALTTTWDRENLSSRQAAASFVATASALGHDVLGIAASASTVYRMRRKHRETEARHLEEEAFQSPPPLVLHWDGKLIPSMTSSRILEERIAVVLTV